MKTKKNAVDEVISELNEPVTNLKIKDLYSLVNKSKGVSLRDKIAINVINSLVQRGDHSGLTTKFIVKYANEIANEYIESKEV